MGQHGHDQIRGARADSWPSYVYLPLPAASAALTEQRRRIGIVRPAGGVIGAQAQDAAELACLAAWRMTQCIYRYDATLYAALIDTPLVGDLPATTLRRLPQWCCYIEASIHLPVADGSTLPSRGAWVWLDHDERGPHDVLWIGWDTHRTGLVCSVIPLVGTLEQAVDRVLADWSGAQAGGATSAAPPASLREGYRAAVPALLSLALYLCADAADLTRQGQPGWPENPSPVRTRRHGSRLFAAQGPRAWDVGVRLGAALRRAYQAEQTAAEDAHASPRPHIRRAHWHGYWLGPRDDAKARRFDLRWMPPIPVNVESIADLPAVIRPVR